ncbi:MAG: hypothetical protein IH805_06510 [Proteobacteria bacterium]|nr:hypothetical protein [Pseudomonadota bacterium]
MSERTRAKPKSLGTWLKYASVLDALGDAAAAARTRERATRVEATA